MTRRRARPGSARETISNAARGAELRRLWNITLVLAIAEFKTRYFGSVLGYLWSLIRPLMLFGVLYLVFTQIIRFGEGIDHYPLKLLLAIVLFNYFQETTSTGVKSLVGNENLIRKIAFPRAVIPLSVALTSAFNLVLSLVAVTVFVLVSGIAPSLSWLAIVPVIAVLVALTVAVSTLLAVLYVAFRDMSPIWEVAVTLLFWGSPIIYTVQAAPPAFQDVLSFSPLALIIEQARHSLIDPGAPTALDIAGGPAELLVPAAIVVAIALASVLLFRRLAPRVAERL